jgi:hypothetical protein
LLSRTAQSNYLKGDNMYVDSNELLRAAVQVATSDRAPANEVVKAADAFLMAWWEKARGDMELTPSPGLEHGE